MFNAIAFLLFGHFLTLLCCIEKKRPIQKKKRKEKRKKQPCSVNRVQALVIFTRSRKLIFRPLLASSHVLFAPCKISSFQRQTENTRKQRYTLTTSDRISDPGNWWNWRTFTSGRYTMSNWLICIGRSILAAGRYSNQVAINYHVYAHSNLFLFLFLYVLFFLLSFIFFFQYVAALSMPIQPFNHQSMHTRRSSNN